MFVYVRNQNGQALMPCTPAKARKLLKAGRARVIRRMPYNQEHFYQITFRPRRTRRQYHDLPRKGQGRVQYQVNEELEGFHKGDVVRVKRRWIKQVNSIYSSGYLAFKRVKGEPWVARPQDCQLLERVCTVLWQNVA